MYLMQDIALLTKMIMIKSDADTVSLHDHTLSRAWSFRRFLRGWFGGKLVPLANVAQFPQRPGRGAPLILRSYNPRGKQAYP